MSDAATRPRPLGSPVTPSDELRASLNGGPPVVSAPGHPNADLAAEAAALRGRVDRLERQLAVMVRRFSERLNDHEKRLDRVDEPPERRWFDR